MDLVRLYSNPAADADHLRRVQSAASSSRPADRSRQSRQHHRRLSITDVAELIKEYKQQASVKELAQRFGIHRVTVTALLRRHDVELRQVGLAKDDIAAAAHLYGQGWSCARLGAKFGVDPTTIWRALRSAEVPMRPQSRCD